MGMNDTPSAERIHIGIFGDRNAGKSSLINVLTRQSVSVVSDVPGTTTDPVKKSMELLPLGPVILTDTPGYDDEGELGEKRVLRSKNILSITDIALLVADATKGLSQTDKELIASFEGRKIPYIIVYNKYDLQPGMSDRKLHKTNEICVSTVTGYNIEELKNMIGALKVNETDLSFVKDFVKKGQYVILVVPIDKAAPKGRLILPQQQAIREILDADGQAIVIKEDALQKTLDNIGVKPSLVITDSQVFEQVAKTVPLNIPLTSFSILMARYKGFLDMAVAGVKKLDDLNDGDKVLISEGCTHHRQCGDIGTEKLPAMIKKYTGKNIDFCFSSGHEFTENIKDYSLIIHCGGCMLNKKEVIHRMNCVKEAGLPVTNYGIAIAYMKGILERSIQIIY